MFKKLIGSLLKLFKKTGKINEAEMFQKRLAFYKNFVSSGDLVFDVGANVGNRVEIFLQLGAKVVAVEPQPECVEVLKSKFDNEIVIEQICLGSKEYETEMFIANENTLSTLNKNFIEATKKTRFSRNTWNNKIVVKVLTLDNLIQKYGIPVLCKIDVEGFEEEVLLGLSNKNIKYISFEYCVPEMKKELLSCVEILNSINQDGLFNYSESETMKMSLEDWVGYSTMNKILNDKNFEKTLFGDIYFKMQ